MTPNERREEADRLLNIIGDQTEQLSDNERRFVEDVADGRDVSPRMLFWLRDIRDKVL